MILDDSAVSSYNATTGCEELWVWECTVWKNLIFNNKLIDTESIALSIIPFKLVVFMSEGEGN